MSVSTSITSRTFSDLDNKWDDTSIKLGLSWRAAEDVLLYAHYSEGFHSGGFFGVNQNTADFERDQYDPEFAENWELGIKSQWFGNRVQVNAALFRNNFDGKQEAFVALDPSTNTVATQFSNVANARYQGLDLEVRWVINEYFDVWTTYGYLDAEYRDFECELDPNGNPGVFSDCSDLTPRQAPENTFGIGGSATFPVGPGSLAFFAKYDWRDELENNLLNWDIGKVDSAENLNASVSYIYNNFTLTLFGNNLTDERTEVIAPIPPLFAASTITVGSTWGVTLDVEF